MQLRKTDVSIPLLHPLLYPFSLPVPGPIPVLSKYHALSLSKSLLQIHILLSASFPMHIPQLLSLLNLFPHPSA